MLFFLQNHLFICQHHYDELLKVYAGPEYEEGSGWFQSLVDTK